MHWAAGYRLGLTDAALEKQIVFKEAIARNGGWPANPAVFRTASSKCPCHDRFRLIFWTSQKKSRPGVGSNRDGPFALGSPTRERSVSDCAAELTPETLLINKPDVNREAEFVAG